MAPRPTGLRDAHLHLAEHGENLGALHLDQCASLGACLERIGQAADAGAARDGSWIVARGARIESWPERRFPTASELDEAGRGRIVMVASFDHHGAAASTAGLSAAGISRASVDPPGGIIQRDRAGDLTGLVLESAYKKLLGAMPPVSDAAYLDHIRAAQRDLVAQGFIEVHDMLASARLAAALDVLDRADELHLSVVLYAIPDAFDAMRAWFAANRPSEKIRFGGLKLFADGTVNSRTAAMLHPYTDPIASRPHGTLLLTPSHLDASFARAAAEGFDVAIHAIGDAAVQTVLDAYERVPGPRPFTLRIEHAEFIDGADAPRFARLGVIASVQPCHLLTDIEAILRLTPTRSHRAFPIRELADRAIDAGRDPAELIWFGSDTPIVPPGPGDNIQAAVRRTRASASGVTFPVIAPHQAIDEPLAWELMRARSYAAASRVGAGVESGSA